MATSFDIPKVFISYSWKPMSNKVKTLALAERMTNDGVNVILDEWNLSEGQDKYQFMEQMVNDPEIKRVLIICNKDYRNKANNKSGGVGTESLIISDSIYKQAEQKKFVPVIFERNKNGEAEMPTFVKSRIYIDLSADDIFEEEYEKLLRNIFDKPLSKKPAIGTPPAYIIEDEVTFLRTSHKVSAIKNALINDKSNYQVFIDEYYSTFLLALSDFKITEDELKSTDFIDELILKKIEALKFLRNDFVTFFETIISYSVNIDNEKFLSFLENLMVFLKEAEKERSSHLLSIDQFRFFYNELFLYIISVLINKEKYDLFSEIVNNDFVFYDDRSGKTEAFTFMYFNQYSESLDKYRNNRLELRRLSVTADLIKQRADISPYGFEKIKESDALLYYVGIMRNKEESWSWLRWFPQTSVYRVHRLPVLEKMASMRHFEKIKTIFDISTIEELKEKVNKTSEIKADKLQRYNHEIPYLKFAFNFDEIGKFK
ncbi:toll/interleukin-1 receptor domain-containing protein [Hwangdonia sp.]|uniref:toll/interleukin-1 receptor domain-containing protein n=1 Tax=Hwangdonia sp. TaxID=1883432 RepID=UPI003AB3AA80